MDILAPDSLPLVCETTGLAGISLEQNLNLWLVPSLGELSTGDTISGCLPVQTGKHPSCFKLTKNSVHLPRLPLIFKYRIKNSW